MCSATRAAPVSATEDHGGHLQRRGAAAVAVTPSPSSSDPVAPVWPGRRTPRRSAGGVVAAALTAQRCTGVLQHWVLHQSDELWRPDGVRGECQPLMVGRAPDSAGGDQRDITHHKHQVVVGPVAAAARDRRSCACLGTVDNTVLPGAVIRPARRRACGTQDVGRHHVANQAVSTLAKPFWGQFNCAVVWLDRQQWGGDGQSTAPSRPATTATYRAIW